MNSPLVSLGCAIVAGVSICCGAWLLYTVGEARGFDRGVDEGIRAERMDCERRQRARLQRVIDRIALDVFGSPNPLHKRTFHASSVDDLIRLSKEEA